MSLSIVIPCRNEEENIETTIKDIESYLKNKINDFEINLINDFSTDRTFEKGKSISINNKIVKIFHEC